MLIREVLETEKDDYDRKVNHPLQSWAWGDFRQKTNVKVLRFGYFEEKNLLSGFQLSVHPVPHTNYTIGYFPKGPLPDLPMLDTLKKIGKGENCLFIKLEPNLLPNEQTSQFLKDNGCKMGRSLFTKYTFQIDLTQSEDQLLALMKEKTRYNVKLAQKAGVSVFEDNSDQAFQNYLQLTFETTKRQKFFAHDRKYHELMWQTLRAAKMAHLLTATYQGKTLVTWILFLFNDVLYYPYGASSSENREVMASNLIMWEAMRWGKNHNAKTFDLWGALGPNPNPKDPWYGFHRFKEGYGGKLVEFLGSYDLVIQPYLYPLYNIVDKLRWSYLKLRSRLSFS